MYLLFFLVPETHLELTKNALFAVGAGSIGHYSHCAWQTLGEGQFMPLSGSDAFIGEKEIDEGKEFISIVVRLKYLPFFYLLRFSLCKKTGIRIKNKKLK